MGLLAKGNMIDLNTIDQSGIRALLNARFEYPEKYVNTPLIIWQVAWHDGIQLDLVMDVMRQDRGNSKDARRYFRRIYIAVGADYHAQLNAPREGITVGFIANPSEPLSLDNCLSEVERLIAANDSARPLIIYLPYKYQPVELSGEKYIFAPDFEQWAKMWSDSIIPDFIRGNGCGSGITYRWYNLFNDPDRGCTTPLVWLAVSNFLEGYVKLTKNYRTDYDICDLGEDLIRSAFQAGMKASKGHISVDVIDNFVKFIKTMVDKNRLIHPYTVTPCYSCSLVDGVLHVNGAHWLAGNRVVRNYEYGLEPEFESPFVHLDFHTVIIGKDIKYLCEGCFNGCKNLKKIVLHDGIGVIEEPITLNADCVKEIVHTDGSIKEVNEPTVAEENLNDNDLPF